MLLPTIAYESYNIKELMRSTHFKVDLHVLYNGESSGGIRASVMG